MQLLVVALAVLAAAPKELKLAAPGLSGVGLQPEYVSYFSEQLADVLSREGVRVITAKEISSLLGFDRQKQLLGCADASASCMAELGNALGVDGLVLGDVAKIGKTFTLTVKIVNSTDGERMAGFSGRASSEEELLERIGTAGREMGATLRERFGVRSSSGKAAAGPPGVYPLRARSWIPAAGAGALAVASGLLFVGAKSQYDSLGAVHQPTLTWPQATDIAVAGKWLQGGAWAAAGLGVASLGVAAWMFFAPGPKLVPLVVPAAGSKGVSGVTLVWGTP